LLTSLTWRFLFSERCASLPKTICIFSGNVHDVSFVRQLSDMQPTTVGRIADNCRTYSRQLSDIYPTTVGRKNHLNNRRKLSASFSDEMQMKAKNTYAVVGCRHS
jgi:hypothetical protein